MVCKHCVNEETRITLLPRELNLPEPFKSALAHYFETANIKKLDWGQVAQLRKDLLNIAINFCDGNKTHAANMLRLERSTVSEMCKKL